MDIRKEIQMTLSELPITEKVFALSIMMDEVIAACRQTQKELPRVIKNISIEDIDPFPDHPYYVEDDENMKDLICSIKKHGVLSPGIVRTKVDGRYEMLSGHRRLYACKSIGIDLFPCEIVDVSDEEAICVMIEANRHRPRLKPCERSQIYNMKKKTLDNILDWTVDLGPEIRIEADDDQGEVQRLLSINNLIPELKEMVDTKQLSIRPASELGCLPEKIQKMVLDQIEYEQCTPSHAQAIRMRKLSQEGDLTLEIINSILREEKPNQRERIVIKDKSILSHMPKDFSDKRKQEYIAEALKFYEKYRG